MRASGNAKNHGNAEPQLGLNKKAELGLGAPGVWHSRGYLPHYDVLTKTQSITFRLADSLPQSKLTTLKEELAHLSEKEQAVERRKRIEQWLDAGMGCCALRHPAVAQTMQETLLRFDADRYRLIAWCVMPNHVHVLILQKQSWRKLYSRGNHLRDGGRWGKMPSWGSAFPGNSFGCGNIGIGLSATSSTFPPWWNIFTTTP